LWKRAWFRLAASALLLGVLFALLPLDVLWQAFGRIPVAYWFVGILLYLLLHMLGAMKWRLVVNAAGADLTLLHAMRFYYAGLFGNTFLPSVVGGDVVRAGLALRAARSRAGLLLGSVVDRTLDVLALACVAGLGVLMLPGALDPRSRGIFTALAVLFVVAGALVIATLLMLPARRLGFRLRRKLVRVRSAVRAMLKRPGTVVFALGTGIALQTGLLLLNLWLGRASGLDVPVRVWFFAWPLAKIAALLPVTQGGLGVREAAQVALLAPFGVPAVIAVAASLAFQAVILAGGLVSGLLSFLLARFGGASSATLAMAKDDSLVTHP
jgi:uncharacterized membrane protein YbhN (UPF0104 family)